MDGGPDYGSGERDYNNDYGSDGAVGSSGGKGNGRMEWKRYKQYTREDILAAIEEVKKGKDG